MSDEKDLRRGRPRGWSVLQAGSPLGSLSRGHERYLREFWQSRRGGLSRLGLGILALWGAYSIIGSDYGLLRLRLLRARESQLQRRVAELTAETGQVQRHLQEDPLTGMERGIREKYRKSKPNEIIYQLEREPEPAADSTARVPSTH